MYFAYLYGYYSKWCIPLECIHWLTAHSPFYLWPECSMWDFWLINLYFLNSDLDKNATYRLENPLSEVLCTRIMEKTPSSGHKKSLIKVSCTRIMEKNTPYCLKLRHPYLNIVSLQQMPSQTYGNVWLRTPYNVIAIGLWWVCSNGLNFISLVKMNHTDNHGGLTRSHIKDWRLPIYRATEISQEYVSIGNCPSTDVILGDTRTCPYPF